MKFPERVTIPMSTIMRKELEELSTNEKDEVGETYTLTAFIRKVLKIFLEANKK